MKARYAVWPVIIFSAVSLAGACSSDSGTGTDTVTGGTDGTGDGGTAPSTGASSSMGATDAGGTAATDAGAPSGGMTTGGAAGAAGAAGATGGDLCEGKDLECPDDDNPCTEDECNPDTGECGIPRSETACDDGVFCNGEDSCDAGECSVHEGNPCTTSCNEAGEYCECETKDDCPADEPGEWSECAWANECVETAMKTRPVTKYTCNGVGKCIGAAAVEQEACTRETDTIACTSDNNRCNGTEKCKAGNCVPDNVDPCKGNAANPYCYNSDPTCRVCKSANFNGSNPMGCSSGQYCCSGACQASSCLVILPTTIPTTVIQTFSQTTN